MNYISLTIEIDVIKNFLERNLKMVDEELSDLFKRKEAGEFCHYIEEFENQCYAPLECEQIATRAVFTEINAFIEWILYGFATLPPEERSKANKFKLIYDMPISYVINSIEEKYNIKLNDLPRYKEFRIMREKINAFKHRKGFKDFRKNEEFNKGGTVNILKRYEVDRKDAYRAIKNAEVFIKAFWDKLNLWPDLERIRRQEESGFIEWQE
jgi:hypothetical protein